MAAVMDPLRNTLDRLALDPKAKEDRRYLVSMLRRLGYTEREIEAVLGWEGEGPRVIELEYQRPSSRGDQGTFSLVRDPVWSQDEVEFRIADEDEVQFQLDETPWPAQDTAWPAEETAWQETVQPEPWPDTEAPAPALEEAWPEPDADQDADEPAAWGASEAQEAVGFSVAPADSWSAPVAPPDAGAPREWTVPQDPALAYGWLEPEEPSSGWDAGISAQDAPALEEAWSPPSEAEGAHDDTAAGGWQEPAQPANEWQDDAPEQASDAASAEGATEPWADAPGSDDTWPDAPAAAQPWPETQEAGQIAAEPPQDLETAWTPEEAEWVALDEEPTTASEDAWAADGAWEEVAQETPEDAEQAGAWDDAPAAWPVGHPEGAQATERDAYTIKQAPNQAWTPSWDEDAQAPFAFGEYTLYTRMVELSTGNEQRIYFFAKNQPKSGQPCALPPGYLVETNERTGLPFLRRDPGSAEAAAWHAPDDSTPVGAPQEAAPANTTPSEDAWADTDDEPPAEEAMDACPALTKAGTQCRRTPREGSKYCAVHKGWRGPRVA